jgi:hypothetical protein
MDAGTAAVLGALAGSVATIGAALATGWAQREGARISARAEHRRQRREPRRDAYKEFIAEISRMRSQVRAISDGAGFPPREVDQEMLRDLRRVADAIKAKSTDVALAGPRTVTEIAIEIEAVASWLPEIVEFTASVPFDGPEVDELRAETHRLFREKSVELGSAFKQLVLEAQAALDDDGSER